jgi:hypothetical protein
MTNRNNKPRGPRALRRRPSASMAVAIVALVVAASGTAVAAGGLANGNKLIKKHSLSGNRLVNKSVTGAQINADSLNTVPSATNALTANYATTADNASNATNASTAINATNATNLGGQPASAYEPAGDFMRSGLVSAAAGQTVNLAMFGPFTLQLDCIAGSGANVTAEILATSTVANSDGYGTDMATAGTAYDVLDEGPDAVFDENNENAADFLTATGSTYLSDLTTGVDFPGAAPSTCFANALTSSS